MTETKQPDADGWIAHDGGPCPVDPDVIVDVRFSDGYVGKGKFARCWRWGAPSVENELRLTHYRIAQPATTAQPSPVRKRTVTEIVLGGYGIVAITGRDKGQIGLEIEAGFYTAAELTDAINTLTAVRDAMEAGE